jgi:GcrA cell cycle regulator
MTWTDERVELLKKLWSDGLSASRIAAEIGGVTRNAVIGKVHRLGLSGRAKATPPAGQRPRKVRPPAHVLRSVRPQVRGNTALARALPAYALEAEAEAEPEVVENVIPLGQRCSLLQLTAETCRWPIGDPGTPDFFFCGGKPVGDLPYCAYHAHMAYQPLTERRREKRLSRA